MFENVVTLTPEVAKYLEFLLCDRLEWESCEPDWLCEMKRETAVELDELRTKIRQIACSPIGAPLAMTFTGEWDKINQEQRS